MRDMDVAKQLLAAGRYTCVLCRDGQCITSTLRGIAPLAEWIASGADTAGACAADRVVGKAAAFLFVLAGVREVYAPVMSVGAAEVFERYGIAHACYEKTEGIRNRAGTGPCPMERAVRGIVQPEDAYRAVLRTMDVLNGSRPDPEGAGPAATSPEKRGSI